MRSFIQITVTPKGERAIRGGHPWVFSDEITAEELGAWAGTISYEMLLAPSPRVPVIYIEPAGEAYAGSSEESEKE